MKLDDIQKEVDADLEILKDRLDYESTRTPKLFNKYYIMLIEARKKLEEYNYLYSELYKKRWMYYSGKAEPEVYKEHPFDHKVLKQDLSIYLDADKDLNDMKYKVSYIKMKITYLQDIIGEIGRRSYHISNALKALQYYHGDLG